MVLYLYGSNYADILKGELYDYYKPSNKRSNKETHCGKPYIHCYFGFRIQDRNKISKQRQKQSLFNR